jgi:argininosuccinate lyase
MNKKLLENFLSSISYDKVLKPYEIETGIVWTKMLAECGIVDKKDAKKVVMMLEKMKDKDLVYNEDIHFSVESTLEKLLGSKKDLAGIIRTARSRNDLVVSDERMYIKDEIKNINKLINNLVLKIVELAEKNIDVPMVGYTHLQPAQPLFFSHYVLSFAWWLLRDNERLKDCYKRVDILVLGSAALAGTSFKIDRTKVAKELGFSNVSYNSVDAVSDRDFIVEFISCLSILSMHLSRMAEELIIYLTPAFGYIKLQEELTSGSSIMPQKENPDYLELIRGKTARVYANLVGILTLMKALPLSYNRDMQEDKIYLFDSVNVVKECLEVLTLVFSNIVVNKEKLEEHIEKFDFIFSTEIANFLVKNFGFNYKQSYEKLKNILKYCKENKKNLKSLTYEEYKKFLGIEFSQKDYQKLLEIFDVKKLINSYDSLGGTSLNQVKLQIRKIKNICNKKL